MVRASNGVVLLVLDTVRKDFFDCYAPRLHKLADIRVEGARAASSWSTPSHASMLTGQLPHQHGVHTYQRDFSEIDFEETFLAQLEFKSTVGITTNTFANTGHNFDIFFDTFCEPTRTHRDPRGVDISKVLQEVDSEGIRKYISTLYHIVRSDHPIRGVENGIRYFTESHTPLGPIPKLSDERTSGVLETATRVTQESSGPFFLFANLMEAHGHYQHFWGLDRNLHHAPIHWDSQDYNFWDLIQNPGTYPDYFRYRRGLYGATIDYLDRRVSEFIQTLIDRHPEVSVILTADHGDNLGYDADQGLLGHCASLSEGLLHVPLCLYNVPDGFELPDDRLVSHLDLGEIVTGLATGSAPEINRELIPAEVIGLAPTPPLPDTFDPDAWHRAIRCVYEDGQKFVWDSNGDSATFQLKQGRPNWQHRLRSHISVDCFPDLFETDIEEYRWSEIDVGETESIAPEERLKRLGYL